MQISKDYAFDLAFLNPLTMKLWGLELGDTLLIQNLDENTLISEFVCSCWPMIQIDTNQISLNNQYVALNNLTLNKSVLVVRKLKKEIQLARNLSIEFLKNFSNNSQNFLENHQNENDIDLIVDFAKQVYLNKSVILKQFIFLNYMGQKLVFIIKSINSKSNNNSSSSVQTINDKLENLNLQNGLLRKIKTKDIFTIDSKTKLHIVNHLNSSEKKSASYKKAEIRFDEIGGLDKEIELIKEFFINPFKYENYYKQVGIEFSKGVLLHGLSGCGKTMLSKAVLYESKCNYVQLNVAEIYSR
jgi:ATP-dependent 26S proteasome regulatory subunit